MSQALTRHIYGHKLLSVAVALAILSLLYLTEPWNLLTPRLKIEGNPMSLIYVFAASESEARPVQRMMARYKDDRSQLDLGRIAKNDVALFLTGIGPRAAKASASSALNGVAPPHGFETRRPDAVLIIGVCGSLTPAIPEGEVIVYSACLSTQNDKSQLPTTQPLAKRVSTLLNARGIVSRPAVGITSRRVATNQQQKLELAKSGAQVVDMESYEIIAEATQAGLPVLVIRTVSDALDRKMPDFNLALDEQGDLNSFKALRVCIGSPILWAQVSLSSRRAVRRLGSALQVMLSEESLLTKPPLNSPR
ncbi:MAG: hypothetical protein AB1898_09580 [Acidobacteriota bacterium]